MTRSLFILTILSALVVANFYYLRPRNFLEKQQGPASLSPPARTRVRNKRKSTPKSTTSNGHRVAELSCKRYGGSSDEHAAEMVYWRDRPQDKFLSSPGTGVPSSNKYLTFEPDQGGFNNVRMAFETAIALSIAMGRILVLPPTTNFYLLSKRRHGKNTPLGVSDFFHLDSVEAEHATTGVFRTMSMNDFLHREALTGNLHDTKTGQATFPFENRTNWNGAGYNWDAASVGTSSRLWKWLRNSTVALDWNNSQCVAAFPNGLDLASNAALLDAAGQIKAEDDAYEAVLLHAGKPLSKAWRSRAASFDGRPTPVNASATDRLREMIVDRRELCMYNETLQEADVIHVKGSSGGRMLIHFYAFLFFQDWRQDLWMKRFVRDHLRYNDEIQCAAARVVQAVREAARLHGSNGTFDSLHIRRNDFQYKDMHMPAKELYRTNLRTFLNDQRTLFIATDERNTSYFDPLREHYHVLFLRDFQHLLQDVGAQYLGMIDQLVASKGDAFVGTYYSTFSGYINRVRGYHSVKDKSYGFEQGIISSFYYTPKSKARYRRIHRTYRALRPNFWQQEYATAWRSIDFPEH